MFTVDYVVVVVWFFAAKNCHLGGAIKKPPGVPGGLLVYSGLTLQVSDASDA